MIDLLPSEHALLQRIRRGTWCEITLGHARSFLRRLVDSKCVIISGSKIRVAKGVRAKDYSYVCTHDA